MTWIKDYGFEIWHVRFLSSSSAIWEPSEQIENYKTDVLVVQQMKLLGGGMRGGGLTLDRTVLSKTENSGTRECVSLCRLEKMPLQHDSFQANQEKKERALNGN